MVKQTQSLSNASLRSRPIINKVHVTREQLSYIKLSLLKKQPRAKHEVDRMMRC